MLQNNTENSVQNVIERRLHTIHPNATNVECIMHRIANKNGKIDFL